MDFDEKLFDQIGEFLSKTKLDDFEELQMEGILTTIEIEKLLMALALKRGDDGFEEEEAFRIIKWAEATRIQEALLDLVLKGLATVDLNDNSEPVFSLTNKGNTIAKEIVDG